MGVGLLVLAAVTAFGLSAVLLDFVFGLRSLACLKTIPPASHGPRISIIVAARNEARGIEAGLASLLQLDYPDLELIVVNDRSTDATGLILAGMSAEHPRLVVVGVTALPGGWLGKNHALWVGAERASGALLLFADADIIFEPSVVRRAVTAMRLDTASPVDHLTAIPDTRVPGVLLQAMVAAFSVFFSMYARPWKARDRRSRHHIGIGAFNLIRASTYRAIGTHKAIALRPDDDLKLGKLVKKNGFSQEVVYGLDLITVEWYSSLTEMIDGLMKNAFAGVDYSLSAVAGSTAALLLMNVWPFVAAIVTTGPTRWLNILSVALICGVFFTSARYARTRAVFVCAYPFASLLFAYIVWRSALIATLTGTITWRGTAYPLTEMRANKV